MRVNVISDFEGEERAQIYSRALSDRVREAISLLEGDGEFMLLTSAAGAESRVPLRQIYYIETVDERVYAYMRADAPMQARRRRLSDIARELDDRGFCRISKSALVNLRHIDSFAPAAGGRQTITLDNGERLIASRQYAMDILDEMRQ